MKNEKKEKKGMVSCTYDYEKKKIITMEDTKV